jgi:hypothetical protein
MRRTKSKTNAKQKKRRKWMGGRRKTTIKQKEGEEN